MPRTLARIVWALIALAAAVSMGTIAQSQGEPVNSTWLVVAAVCTYLIGYRFYAAFIAAKVMALDDTRATPAERLRVEPMPDHPCLIRQ
jgi:carbon starvation protein